MVASERIAYAPARWKRMSGFAAAAALLVTVGVAGGRLTASRATQGADIPPAVAALQPAVPTAVVQPVAQFRSAEEARSTLNTAEAGLQRRASLPGVARQCACTAGVGRVGRRSVELSRSVWKCSTRRWRRRAVHCMRRRMIRS